MPFLYFVMITVSEFVKFSEIHKGKTLKAQREMSPGIGETLSNNFEEI